MPQQVDVGLKGNQILQRYLVRRIFHEFELAITEPDGHRTVGFITGFDDVCIQVSTTPVLPQDEPRAVLICWPVRRIEETGSRMDCLPIEHRRSIRRFSKVLRAQCEAVLNQSTNGRSPKVETSPIV